MSPRLQRNSNYVARDARKQFSPRRRATFCSIDTPASVSYAVVVFARLQKLAKVETHMTTEADSHTYETKTTLYTIFAANDNALR